MTKGIGSALLATTLMVAISAQLSPAAAGAGVQSVQILKTTDVSARRHDRHTRYAYRPYYPTYYARPYYYAPAPFLPIPPLFGYGWEWW